MKSVAGLGMPAIMIAILLGLLLGSGGYTLHYSAATSYLSNDPRACVNCHVMREHYDGWQKASHHGSATCNDCHIPERLVPKYAVKAENGFWHSKGFTLQDFHEPIRIRPSNGRVLNDNCRRCHADLVCEVAGSGPDALACVRCHEGVGHGPAR